MWYKILISLCLQLRKKSEAIIKILLLYRIFIYFSPYKYFLDGNLVTVVISFQDIKNIFLYPSKVYNYLTSLANKYLNISRKRSQVFQVSLKKEKNRSLKGHLFFLSQISFLLSRKIWLKAEYLSTLRSPVVANLS